MAKVVLQTLASCAFLATTFGAGIGIPDDSTDPCLEGNYLSIVNQTFRSAKLRPYSNPNYSTQGDGDFNTSVWLRFRSPSGEDLVTSCPKKGSCGTDFPVWLEGSIPSANDGIVSRKAYAAHYLTGNESPCHRKAFSIEIKNCGTFRVYRLPPTTGGGMGYCVGNEKLCRTGMTSPNGWTPGCVAITTTTKLPGQTSPSSPVTTAAVVHTTTTISQSSTAGSTLDAVLMTTKVMSAAPTPNTTSNLGATSPNAKNDVPRLVDVYIIAAATVAAGILVINLVVLTVIVLRRKRQQNRSGQNDQEKNRQTPDLIHENEAYGPLHDTYITYETLPDDSCNNRTDKYKDRPLPVSQNEKVPDYQDLDKETRNGHVYESPRDLDDDE